MATKPAGTSNTPADSAGMPHHVAAAAQTEQAAQRRCGLRQVDDADRQAAQHAQQAPASAGAAPEHAANQGREEDGTRQRRPP